MSTTAGEVQIVFTAQGKSYSDAIDDMGKKVDQLKGKAVAAGHGTVSSMQAASASIRLLDNPLGSNVRAIERLISQSKVLSSVMKTAFPVVGGIAAGVMLAKLGAEVAGFVKSINGMPRAINQGFAALNLSTKTSTDEIILSTDKMRDHLAILEHRPAVNGAKIAADEIALAADKAAERIINANSKLNELLSKNHLSGWAVLLGKQGTGDRENAATKFGQQADDAAYDLANATTPAQTAAAQAKLAKVQADQLRDAQDDLARRQRVAAGPDAKHTDDSANTNIDKGVITAILNQRKQVQAEAEQALVAGQTKQQEDLNEAAQKAKAAAAKAASDQLHQFETARELFDDEHGKDLQDDYAYWASKTSAFVKGSSEYRSVIEKQTALAREGAAKAHEAILEQQRKDRDTPSKAEGDEIVNRGDDSIAKQRRQDASDAYSGFADSNALALVKARNNAEEQAAKIQDAMGVSMSHVAAAAALAALHTKSYSQEVFILQANAENAAAQLAADPKNKGAQKTNEEAQANLDTASKARTLQAQADNDNLYGRTTSGLVGFDDALDEFVARTRDNAAQMKKLADDILNSANGALMRDLTSKNRSDRQNVWHDAGKQVFTDVASSALNKIEGKLLGELGFGGGKLGTALNPMWVRSAGGGPGGPGGGPGGAGGPIKSAGDALGGTRLGQWLGRLGGTTQFSTDNGPDAGDYGSDGGNAGDDYGSDGGTTSSMAPPSAVAADTQKFTGMALMALPMFANGTDFAPGGPAWVGDGGEPEIVNLPRGASVTPLSKTSTMQMGGVHHHWNIDARGATDPAQVKMQARQAVIEAAPHIVAASAKNQKDSQRRSIRPGR